MVWTAQQLLKAIRDSGMRECVTETRLVELTGLTPQQVEKATLTLRRNHLLEKTGQGCHTLTSAGIEALKSGAKVCSGPRGARKHGKRIVKNSLRIRVWHAIRIRRKFSIPDIVELVVEGTERGNITSNVQKYIRALFKAGYLIEMPKREAGSAVTSNGFKRWWLLDEKDTGRLAPVWRAERQTVFDRNTNEEHDISKGEDA